MMLSIGDITYNLECWSTATDVSRHITSRGNLELRLSDISVSGVTLS